MASKRTSVRAALEEDGGLLRITLEGVGNPVLDRSAVAAIGDAVESQGKDRRTRAVLLAPTGSHFSYGSSIEEHRAGEIGAALAEFHELFRGLARSRKVLLAAVRGSCLGGGLELASFCHRVFAAPDAKLGHPEIGLGVFAPVASIVLPLRIGQPAADDLLLSGRIVDADEALRLRLVDEVDPDPAAAALRWYRTHLSGKSASSLAHAVRAARARLHAELGEPLSRLERLYLDSLMATGDANEGIEAFLGKRAPRWKHQ
jgi:cyclohexa-1,5-dienecarbonyl-CoA hydratase